MTTQETDATPSGGFLDKYRRQYSSVDHSRRGEPEDRAAHHSVILEDWHPHRSATGGADEAETRGKAGE
jgi:hypothetical protein